MVFGGVTVSAFSKFWVQMVSKKLLEHSSAMKPLCCVMILILGLPNNFFQDSVWWDWFCLSPKSGREFKIPSLLFVIFLDLDVTLSVELL